MRNKKGHITIGSILIFIILVAILVFLFNIYKHNTFYEFEKAITKEVKTNFTRDSKVKYSKANSYKIESVEYNDAVFYKEIEVEPNTPYRITCMVKTENVICEQEGIDGGATIGILDTRQYSIPLEGTNDWQKVEYIFNSMDNDKVKVSFRLGGNDNNCKGTVWFSDFKLEKGTKNTDSEWKIACFFLNEIDTVINGKEYNLKLNLEDKENAKLNLERYKNDCYSFSNGKMNVTYDIFEVYEPIKRLSYSEEHGYHVSPEDCKQLIYNTVKENDYDHIFVVCRMENENGTLSIPIIDNWIGLGGMDMYGIGYSIIRINSNSNKYTYRYGITNQAPEEVFLHEFLHTLERNCIDSGKNIPALHDYEKYGYSEKNLNGLFEWYKDYMRRNIYDESTGNYIGLYESCYKTQPFNSDNFKHAVEIELNKEPQNIIEEINAMIKILSNKK